MHNSMATPIGSIKAETTFVPIAHISADIFIEFYYVLEIVQTPTSFILVIRL